MIRNSTTEVEIERFTKNVKITMNSLKIQSTSLAVDNMKGKITMRPYYTRRGEDVKVEPLA